MLTARRDDSYATRPYTLSRAMFSPGPGSAIASPATRLPIAFLILFAAGVALGWQTLSWPMVYDDLHLIRRFSAHELTSSFHGSWDPDKVEEPGLRPFSMLFNHLRYVLFGEHVVAHRLFALALFALYLSLVSVIATVFGMPWNAAILAGILCFASKYSVYHYVWLTDTVHLVQGVAFGVSVIMLCYWLNKRHWWTLLLSIIASCAGLATREDTLSVVLVMILLGGVYAYSRRLSLARWRGYSISLVVISVAFMVYRRIVVPEAQVPGTSVRGVVALGIKMLNIMGLAPFDLWSAMFLCGWGIAVLFSIGGLITLRRRLCLGHPVLWGVCALLACSTGLNMSRSDLLLFPVTFTSLFLCATFIELARISGVKRVLIGCAVIWGLVGEGYITWVFQQTFHPWSSISVGWNYAFLYGGFSDRARIPVERRRMTAGRLAAIGLCSPDDSTEVKVITERALAENKRKPEGEGEVFVPRLRSKFQY